MHQETQPRAIVLAAGEGRALWHLGALITFKAVAAETDGRFWAIEGRADRQMAVPLHAHERDDEIWFIADGEIGFRAGDQEFVRGPGSFAFIPRGVPHTFRVVSPTARWYGVGLPGGLDQWFFDTGAPAGALVLPPPAAAAPTDAEVRALTESLRAYGTETLGPPMA